MQTFEGSSWMRRHTVLLKVLLARADELQGNEAEAVLPCKRDCPQAMGVWAVEMLGAQPRTHEPQSGQ